MLEFLSFNFLIKKAFVFGVHLVINYNRYLSSIEQKISLIILHTELVFFTKCLFFLAE